MSGPRRYRDLGTLQERINEMGPDGKLIISYMNLTELLDLPSGLKKLYCTGNKQLTRLPELPAGLEVLVCSFNGLTALPNLPSGLKHLECDFNQLTRLPDLPASLEYLDCTANQLTELPELPASLLNLYCPGNPFKEPFKTFYEIYMSWPPDGTMPNTGEKLNELRTSIHEYYESQRNIQRRGRNVASFMGTSKSRIGLPSNVESRIGSYLSGVNKNLGTQLKTLKGQFKLRRSRKNRRKVRKTRRSRR
jgi:hypothetical protein